MERKSPKKTIFNDPGPTVTIVGLGGEGVLRTYGRKNEARMVIQDALDHGITYFDSARVYSDSEIYYGSVWSELPETRAGIFQTSKSAGRYKHEALKDLEETLKRMNTSYLDLWQIHDVRTERDLEVISGPGGALEAFTEAKSSGRVRFIGVTAHYDPDILTKAVINWPVDAVMMPVNPVEGIIGGFLTSTLPAAQEKGIAVIAMKVLGGSHYVQMKMGISAELLLRYALSHDITVAIVGCSTSAEVKTLANVGSNPEPLSDKERLHLRQFFEPYANRLAFYRK
ncbi:MAG: aldo/keto reductase [Thermodesulfobacteriota bacterium]|nr:aldo/keto reductase [Thermodesulfobacteriota bacterium]